MVFDKLGKLYRKIADDYYLGESIYLVAFALFIAVSVWQTTAFEFSWTIYKVVLLIFMMATAVKIIIFDGYTGWQLILIGIAGIGIAGRYASGIGSANLIALLLMVVAAKNVDFDKIVKIYLIVAGGIVFLALVAALLKVIPNYHWYGDNRHKYALGLTYCTDAAAHYFFLLLSYFYIRKDKLKIIEYILAVVYALLVFSATGGKLDVSCNIFTIVVFALGNFVMNDNNHKMLKRRSQTSWENAWKAIGPFTMPCMALLMSVLTYLYKDSNATLVWIDEFITGRLRISRESIEKYGLGLFGKDVVLIGNGHGRSSVTGEYNFVDSSYLYMALIYGVLLAIVVVFIYSLISVKHKNNLYIQYVVAVIAINAAIAHHLLDPAYNIFIVAIMAKVSDTINEYKR